MILSDTKIKEYLDKKDLSITPLSDDSVRENGVDLRISHHVAIPDTKFDLIDTRNPGEAGWKLLELRGKEHFDIKPNSRFLLATLEKVKFPSDLMASCNLRSTVARFGISSPPTIIDSGFKGNITIECNYVGGNRPLRLYIGSRFLHVVFSQITGFVEKPYKGFYQNQSGVQFPKPID